ncbi:MAG TPA: glycoside hydrolase [Candidatus Omnitrophica bacterium]|nr:glycoside hydrolase [Candidatus Omnitrophota bacterium]
MTSHPLYVAFIWHMHQPYYRDLRTGECTMPWVRLHATKDYLDMVKLLEEFPSVHQTFNFVPSLLDQLQAYLPPSNRTDSFLDLSRKPAADLTDDDKRFLTMWFFLANEDHMVKPHPRYHDLLIKRGTTKPFKPQDCLDLQVWFNLVWIDPWLRRQDPQLAALEAKGERFAEADKQLVLGKQLELIAQILPTYQAAQARGQVELTTSPYYHPIVPLLCEIRSAHAALPHLPLPERPFRHPEDAQWHVGQALKRHEEVFGVRPHGMWPPEGGVSEALIALTLAAGLRWIATDEEILWRTLRTARDPSLLYRPHAVTRHGQTLAAVFRDRELSDLLGFVYSQWDAALAVKDFMSRLHAIHRQVQHLSRPPLLTIALDGENAWEHYPQDGHAFLRALYGTLASDERIQVVTVSEFLNRFPPDRSSSLPELFAGSWIDGNFSTWVGHPEKNTAWAYLSKTREALSASADSAVEHDALTNAWRSLYIAEGSDWMWWYGDTHYSSQQEEFDRLFRTHLANVYRFLGQPPPDELDTPIKPVTSAPSCEPTAIITPHIDGRQTTYYEWLYAGRIDLHKHYGALHRGGQLCHTLYYGFDATHFYFRLDVEASQLTPLNIWSIQFVLADRHRQFSIQHTPEGLTTDVAELRWAFERILEVGIPRAWLMLKPGDLLTLQITMFHGTDPLERYPAQGGFRLPLPREDVEASTWSV